MKVLRTVVFVVSVMNGESVMNLMVVGCRLQSFRLPTNQSAAICSVIFIGVFCTLTLYHSCGRKPWARGEKTAKCTVGRLPG